MTLLPAPALAEGPAPGDSGRTSDVHTAAARNADCVPDSTNGVSLERDDPPRLKPRGGVPGTPLEMSSPSNTSLVNASGANASQPNRGPVQAHAPRRDESLVRGRRRYEQCDAFLGEGTYGRVEKAKDLLSGQVVAIKKVRVGNDATLKTGSSSGDRVLLRQNVGNAGLHFTTVRELKVMRELRGELNVMSVLDLYVDREFICLVMELMHGDLKKLAESKIRLSVQHVKCIMLQLLRGLHALHRRQICHRDLAPANIFINRSGICKVADFGLSRSFGCPGLAQPVGSDGAAEPSGIAAPVAVSRKELMTAKVVTLWYRPPELLFGADRYGPAVDMWSVGCIMAELLTGTALFPGLNEVDQLSRIFSLRGTPAAPSCRDAVGSSGLWPGAAALPSFFPFGLTPAKSLRTVLPFCCNDSLDLLDQLLQVDPSKRVSAADALTHRWFHQAPKACEPRDLSVHLLGKF